MIQKIIDSVRGVLNDEGLYTPILDMAIEDFAQVSHLKQIAFDDAVGGEGRSTVYETSREGDRRYKVNPAYSIYLDLVRESQRILDALCMTAKSAGSVQGDDFDELKRKMTEASNG